MFADPFKNITQFDLMPGMKVADFGAGSGFYSLAAAKNVEGGGKVYAIEVQKDLLTRLKNTALRENVHNIEVVWGDIEKLGGTRLRDESVDRVIVSNILFQVENKKGLVEEVKRVLKSRGKVLLIDWDDTVGVVGPKREELVSKEDASELFTNEGFVVEAGVGAGEHHYGLIFSKQ